MAIRPRHHLALAFFVAALCLVAAPGAHATFPGPDGAIAFPSPSDPGDISAMRPDGSEVRTLTRTPGRTERAPDWSPDGSQLAYSYRDEGKSRVGIAVIGRCGGSATEVTSRPLPATVEDPAWSPDGSKILFERSGGRSETDIFLVNADGSGLKNLTNTSGDGERDPAWSPDGSKIVFSDGADLFTMDAAGANRVQLTPPRARGPSAGGETAAISTQPDWSPDGTRIAYFGATLLIAGTVSASSGIYVIPAAGGSPTLLVSDASSTGTRNLNAGDTPSWSPSGTKIAYYSWSTSQIFTINANGSARSTIHSMGGGPDWGPAQTYGDVAGCETKPKLGRSVLAQRVSGVVKVRRRGSKKYVALTGDLVVPVGSLLDTRKGVVRLKSARNRAGKTQSGTFSKGVFQVKQSRKRSAKGLTELRLKGSSFRGCGGGGSNARAAASRRTIRRLRAKGKGSFRTRGRYSAATVRGTTWTTTDRCDGTLTKVSSGRVSVRDLRKRKTVLVRAGRSYLARR